MSNETQQANKDGKNKKHEAPPPASSPAAPTTSMTPPPAPPASTAIEAPEIFDFTGDEGGGFETQTMADVKLPIIELLQSGSPAVKESKGKGPFAGQFRNTVTGEIYDEVYFVPGTSVHQYTEWLPRDDGGGFRGRHPIDAKVVHDAVHRNGGRRFGKLPVPQPPDPKTGKPQPMHELVEGEEIFAILYDPKTEAMAGFAMIPFVSTKIPIFQAWNSTVRHFAPTFHVVFDAAGTPVGQYLFPEPAKKKAAEIGGKVVERPTQPQKIPMFAHRVKMTSDVENKGAHSWMLPVLTPVNGDLKNSLIGPGDPRYIAAKKLKEDVQAGLANAAYETSQEQQATVDPESGVPF